ncbi:Uu.00g138860.m01.CDS01 [Anthostomella pinea]|uniref:Uu.00g138860.m01.CDS01 n=1 Tax=Anthostomella pinea TaxID=933095 RepID=A0AAI8VJC7_9PEZI|nr:Uu.00g138860.m01.CDS01 [Anthostomella pinea]
MGMADIVRTLLEKGADVNMARSQIQRVTPLMLAFAHEENKEVVDILMDHGADVTLKDSQRCSALIHAFEFFQPEHACFLISKGLPVDDLRWDKFLECTKLIFQNHPELDQDFIKESVQIALSGSCRCQLLTDEYLIANDIGLGLRSREDSDDQMTARSALHSAADNDDMPIELLASLLQKRIGDVNIKSWNGETPASLVLGHCPKYRSEKVTHFLKNGADPSVCGNEKGRAILKAIQDGVFDEEIKKIVDGIDERSKAEAKLGRRKEKGMITSRPIQHIFGVPLSEILALKGKDIDATAELERLYAGRTPEEKEASYVEHPEARTPDMTAWEEDEDEGESSRAEPKGNGGCRPAFRMEIAQAKSPSDVTFRFPRFNQDSNRAPDCKGRH